MGGRSVRLEPGEPGRQLEQVRQELPVGEPQQEQPVEPQQQPGLPPCPEFRWMADAGVTRRNRPFSCLSERKPAQRNLNLKPLGAGSLSDGRSNAPGGFFCYHSQDGSRIQLR